MKADRAVGLAVLVAATPAVLLPVSDVVNLRAHRVEIERG